MLRTTGSGGSTTAQFHRQAQDIGNTGDFLKTKLRESVAERLTSMAEYAESSLSAEMILWDRMDALRQMLRGEIARLRKAG
jgi:hypothetical protein